VNVWSGHHEQRAHRPLHEPLFEHDRASSASGCPRTGLDAASRRHQLAGMHRDYAEGSPLDAATDRSTRQQNVVDWLTALGAASSRH